MKRTEKPRRIPGKRQKLYKKFTTCPTDSFIIYDKEISFGTEPCIPKRTGG